MLHKLITLLVCLFKGEILIYDRLYLFNVISHCLLRFQRDQFLLKRLFFWMNLRILRTTERDLRFYVRNTLDLLQLNGHLSRRVQGWHCRHRLYVIGILIRVTIVIIRVIRYALLLYQWQLSREVAGDASRADRVKSLWKIYIFLFHNYEFII